MPLTGQHNLTGQGDFLILNKISLKALLALEKQVGTANAFYLMEETCPLEPSVEHYLNAKSSSGISFRVDMSDMKKLREFLKEKLDEHKTIIYLPGIVSAIKGSICHIPDYILEALGDFNIPPIPVFVAHYGSTILKAEVPTDAEGTTYVTILPKLEEGPQASARVAQAWMEASAEQFAALPQLQGSLASAIVTGMKQHMDARIIDGIDDSTLTFGKLLGVAIAFSKRLAQITSDRRIGIILPPGKGGTIANLACLFAGKVPVNINYANSESAFASAVDQSGIERFITADTFVRKLQSFPWPPQRDLIFLERELPSIKSSIRNWVIAARLLPAHILIKTLKLNNSSGEDEAVLLFTSGSSSEPKGVPLSHRNILGNIAQASSRIVLQPKSRFLSSLPVFHGFGITIGLFFPLISGHDYVTYPSPAESKRLGELIRLYNTALVVSTPTFLRGFLRRCKPGTFEGVQYLIVGAEKLPPDLAKTFTDKFAINPLEGYGLSEASPVCSVNFENPKPVPGSPHIIPGFKKGSVGECLPGIAVRITDPYSDKPLPMTYKGMIWLKGINIFSGYLGKEPLNRQVFQNGWFRTGDIGSCDTQGFLRIEGRLARFSKIAGEMVSHEAVELALMHALKINAGDDERHLAVVSIPDEQRGEAIAMLSTTIREYIPQQIMSLRYSLLDQGNPAIWTPREIIPVNEIPILPTGKLDLAKCKQIAYEALRLPQHDL